MAMRSSKVLHFMKEKTFPLERGWYTFQGTVSRDGRGYKSGINQKVSLNPGTSEAKTFILLPFKPRHRACLPKKSLKAYNLTAKRRNKS